MEIKYLCASQLTWSFDGALFSDCDLVPLVGFVHGLREREGATRDPRPDEVEPAGKELLEFVTLTPPFAAELELQRKVEGVERHPADHPEPPHPPRKELTDKDIENLHEKMAALRVEHALSDIPPNRQLVVAPRMGKSLFEVTGNVLDGMRAQPRSAE